MTKADGDALLAQGNFGEALKLYRDSLTISERLTWGDSADFGWLLIESATRFKCKVVSGKP
jgi:hypothetical protein